MRAAHHLPCSFPNNMTMDVETTDGSRMPHGIVAQTFAGRVVHLSFAHALRRTIAPPARVARLLALLVAGTTAWVLGQYHYGESQAS
eukprot:5596997-Alexandrium_andersonii.AAC.1